MSALPTFSFLFELLVHKMDCNDFASAGAFDEVLYFSPQVSLIFQRNSKKRAEVLTVCKYQVN